MGAFFTSLLNIGWADYFKKIFGEGSDAYTAASNALGIVEMLLWIILAVVGVAGIIYSIWLGIKLARAEDQSKRDEAKKHLITVVIAIAVTLVLVIFFNIVLPLILGALYGDKSTNPVAPSGMIGLLMGI